VLDDELEELDEVEELDELEEEVELDELDDELLEEVVEPDELEEEVVELDELVDEVVELDEVDELDDCAGGIVTCTMSLVATTEPSCACARKLYVTLGARPPSWTSCAPPPDCAEVVWPKDAVVP
jgi:hypothetical protein